MAIYRKDVDGKRPRKLELKAGTQNRADKHTLSVGDRGALKVMHSTEDVRKAKPGSIGPVSGSKLGVLKHRSETGRKNASKSSPGPATRAAAEKKQKNSVINRGK